MLIYENNHKKKDVFDRTDRQTHVQVERVSVYSFELNGLTQNYSSEPHKNGFSTY